MSPPPQRHRRTPVPVALFLFCNRVYEVFARAVKGLLGVVKAIHVGVWLGVLSRRSLHALDERFYSREDVYASRDHARRGLFPWEVAALERHFAHCRSIAVTSVGAGREVLALLGRGYRSEGWECNPDLVALASEYLAEAGVGGEVHASERDVCPDLGKVFDGAIVGWSGYMHIQGRQRRIAFLRDLCGFLPENAPILLSFFVRPRRDRLHRIVAAVARPLRWVLRREPPERGDVLDPFFQHYFTEEEIQAELAAAGFRMVHFSREGYGHAVGLAGPPSSP
jgi:hypothetical protein